MRLADRIAKIVPYPAIFEVLYVQEVVTHFINKMGHYFLDR